MEDIHSNVSLGEAGNDAIARRRIIVLYHVRIGKFRNIPVAISNTPSWNDSSE